MKLESQEQALQKDLISKADSQAYKDQVTRKLMKSMEDNYSDALHQFGMMDLFVNSNSVAME